jgi:putative thiamine transport system ATP-binding protein
MNDGLVLTDITLSIGGRTLIDRLNLSVAPGQILGLMGPSGAGKSSLIGYLCGALDHRFTASGGIALDGVAIEHLPIERRRVGVLFQDDILFAHMTVGENLGFAVARNIGRAARRARVEQALAEAELNGFADRDPATLSGGQRARVALMRAMLAEPRALLLDEPFARLDPSLRERMRQFTFATIAARGIPALLVTHDLQDIPGPVLDLGHATGTGAIRR